MTNTEITRKLVLDIVRIGTEAHTWEWQSGDDPAATGGYAGFPFFWCVDEVTRALTTEEDCATAKGIVSRALAKMTANGSTTLGYLTKEYVRSTLNLISYYAAGVKLEDRDRTEITKVSNPDFLQASTDRLTEFIRSAREGDATAAPYILYEYAGYNGDNLAKIIASVAKVSSDTITVHEVSVEPNVFREKEEYYGHRPWVITPDLPLVIVTRTGAPAKA